MVRGGGFGGGGQIMELLGALAAIPGRDLLWIGLGLLLMALIVAQMLRAGPVRPRAVPRATACLICGRELAGARAYVDRHLPTWVACGRCYERLTPAQQRQYRADEPGNAPRRGAGAAPRG
jgi:hypothetical protein